VRSASKTALDRARAQHLPYFYRIGKSFDLDGVEIAVFEQIAEQPSRALIGQYRVWLGEALQPRGKVGRVSDDAALPRLTAAD